jgi:hypothetical protein
MAVFLGNKPVNIATLGNKPATYFNRAESELKIPTNGLLFFLDATTYPGSGDWLSRTGSLALTASLFGTPTYDTTNKVFSFNSVSGLTTPIGEPNLTGSDYSIFYTGRYSGSISDKHGRILVGGLAGGEGNQSVSKNWTLGMFSGSYIANANVGPAYLVPGNNIVFPPSGSYDTSWRCFGAVCDFTAPFDATQQLFVNGNELTSSFYNITANKGPFGLGVNSGSYTTGTSAPPSFENSVCEIGDIVVYNRVLTNDEIQVISSYLEIRVGL